MHADITASSHRDPSVQPNCQGQWQSMNGRDILTHSTCGLQVSAMPFKALEQHFGHERTLSILDAVRGHSNEAVEVSHPVFAALRCAPICVFGSCTLALLALKMVSPRAPALWQPTLHADRPSPCAAVAGPAGTCPG